jgi:hypothetical protein
MTDLPENLDVLGRDLQAAFARRVARARRRSRRLRVAGAVGALACAFCAVAVASGIGPELQLDPTKWAILGGGSVDEGRGEYVHAQSKEGKGNSTFMVEHDQGIDRYDAFLLHERLRAAAAATSPVPVQTEPGPLCTRAELTRAEVVALETMRTSFAPATPANATKQTVDRAVRAAFGDVPCRGLEYGGEVARLVYAGVEPTSNLMPGAR